MEKVRPTPVAFIVMVPSAAPQDVSFVNGTLVIAGLGLTVIV